MDDDQKLEACYAAMQFLILYQTTADDNFIYDVTKQIRLLWKGVKMERERAAKRDQRPATRPLKLVRG